MVRSQIRKSTFREIKSSMGRFLSIMAIIGLGVGFFGGLKIAKQAMVTTVEGYLNEHAFYDYRLLSTLGFDQDSVDYLSERENVSAAEGALSFDALYYLESGQGGSEQRQGAIKFHSLTDRLNTVKLTAGRMPENELECVVDNNLFAESDLGAAIVLAQENDEETLEHFAAGKYTIVGLVQSPLYLQYERGNTSLGSGRLAGFVYIPVDGFAEDYYTEIYVSFAEEYGLYSKAYENYLDRTQNDWESYGEQAANLRYQTLLNDAQQELADARAEFEDQKAEGEMELADAAAGLADAAQKIADGEQQLADARRELEDGRKTLREKEKELADARTIAAEKEAELAAGEKALAEAKAELMDAEATVSKKEAELADGRAEYEEGMQEYQDAQAEFKERIADAEAELADAEAKLRDLEQPDTYLLGRNTNVGYVCFENDSSIVEGIANIFPVFFVLVAALVCVTTMNRMVEEQRTQIGVLKAIGYGEGRVMSKYLTYSGLASLIGCVVGFLLGTWVFPRVIWAAYGIMYKTEALVYVFDWKLAVIALAVSLLCSMGTTWLSCRVELTQVAAQLMRPKAPKAGKRVFLEHIPFVWNRLSFLRKVSIRNIFRYKKRLFMMILGISGCTALLVTGFGIKDSIADIATKQFQEIQVFDLSVTFQDPVGGTAIQEMEEIKQRGIETYLCVMEKNMDLVTDKGIKSIYLIAGDPEQMPEFVNLHTESGEQIPYPGLGEAVISDKLAAEYGVQQGDTITLRDEEMQELHLTVIAIQENYIYNYVHISEATWEEQTGEEPQRKTAYVNVQVDADVHETAAVLMQFDNVANVTVNLDTMERVGSMMASLNIIVVAVILSAAGLAFIVLYNLTNINITERIREIATIKVLGFYKKETESYVYRENLLLSAMGMVLGLALGKLLHSLVMSQIQIDMIAFDISVRPVSYVYSGLLTIGFAWFVGKTMGGKLENISMTESLKSVD